MSCPGNYNTTGNVVSTLNMRGTSKCCPRLIAVKRCCDQAVRSVFQGHATVQLQGSTAKGTGLLGHSDWDFFVKLDATILTVTHNQRMTLVHTIAHYMSSAGISYSMQCGQNRVWMRSGRDQVGALPDVDLVFARFKLDDRLPPNSKALATSNTAQLVVKYIKLLPERYTNLPKPKSSLTEQVVMKVVKHLHCQQGLKKEQLVKNAGFDRLLTATLQAIAGQADMQGIKGMQEELQQAKLTGEWTLVAERVLRDSAAGKGWPLEPF